MIVMNSVPCYVVESQFDLGLVFNDVCKLLWRKTCKFRVRCVQDVR